MSAIIHNVSINHVVYCLDVPLLARRGSLARIATSETSGWNYYVSAKRSSGEDVVPVTGRGGAAGEGLWDPLRARPVEMDSVLTSRRSLVFTLVGL